MTAIVAVSSNNHASLLPTSRHQNWRRKPQARTLQMRNQPLQDSYPSRSPLPCRGAGESWMRIWLRCLLVLLFLTQWHAVVLATAMPQSSFAASSSWSSSSSVVTSTSSTRSTLLLRIRLPNGSMERVQVSTTAITTVTLRDLIRPLLIRDDAQSNHEEILAKLRITVGSAVFDKMDTILSDIHGLQHGTLITISDGALKDDVSKQTNRSRILQRNKAQQQSTTSQDRFDPFPELAKDYQAALRKLEQRRGTRSSGSGALIASPGLSFTDLSTLRASLHNIEPQPTGPWKRVYMCRTAAERFQHRSWQRAQEQQQQQQQRKEAAAAAPAVSDKKSKSKKNKSKIEMDSDTVLLAQEVDPICHVALLLGTVQRERVDAAMPRRPKTSLSSTTQAEEYCQAVKVHAMVEVSSLDARNQKDDNIMPSSSFMVQLLASCLNGTTRKGRQIMRIARALDIQPVGWIFAYTDQRHLDDKGTRADRDASLPVHSTDMIHAAQLQIAHMKKSAMTTTTTATETTVTTKSRERSTGTDATSTAAASPYQRGFLTLAMNFQTGATEAFQLSDVMVQMAAEDMFTVEQDAASTTITSDNQQKTRTKANQNRNDANRYLYTKYAVVVDGTETQQLDSVLCLINTAMLSHQGWFAGANNNQHNKAVANPIKKNGRLTKKMQKLISHELVKLTGSPSTLMSASGLKSSTKESLTASEVDHGPLLMLLCDFQVLLALDDLLHNEEESNRLCGTIRKWARGQKRGTRLDDALVRRLHDALVVDDTI